MGNEKRILVVCEKPSVARTIGEALGCTEYTKTALNGNGYVVSWCFGHLVETAQAAAYGEEYIKWSYEDLPILPKEWKYEVKPKVREQFAVLKKLMRDESFSEVICATDAGREGELIFRLVYEKAGCKLPVKRLWLSSLEEKAILEGFSDLRDGKEFDNLYQSALARQKADWLVGINGTRLFSVLYGNKVHKVGRVQSPTLSMIVMRERKIREFKKKPYYTVQLETSGLLAVYDRFEKKEEAEELAEACDMKQVRVLKVGREEKHLPAPKPFDLTSLQREANRIFGFTAKQTLEYTQSLYEQKLCTYPRTDSRYLSDDMDETVGKVLEAVGNSMTFASDVNPYAANIKAILNSSKVTDHHAIIPTEKLLNADLESLPGGEKKILHLIAAGFVCSVLKPAVDVMMKAELECAGTKFTSTKTFHMEKGWKSVYEAMKSRFTEEAQKDEENEDPDITGCFSNLVEGMSFPVRATLKEGFTKPPKRFTEATLLSAMEKAGAEDIPEEVKENSKQADQNDSYEEEEQRNKEDTWCIARLPKSEYGKQPVDEMEYGSPRHGLGTPATRADIIEKLVRDGYVRREKKSLVPTDAGIELVTILPEVVRSPKLTADWENALMKISRGELDAEAFLEGIETMVRELVGSYHGISEKR